MKQYSALAISAVVADASAQVVYTDINDVTLTNDGDFFDIDLNNDGTTEVNLSFSTNSGTFYGGLVTYDVNFVNGDPMNSAEINVISSSIYVGPRVFL